ncbi:MAG: hypothetical protein SF069_10530 [Phycisphaerae bacterium]|nr:hypothetical protein [Phycisphaerae bacterium]
MMTCASMTRRLLVCGTGAALWGASPSLAQVTNLNTSEPFATIQAAINDSDTLAGHTIEVSNGTYNENVLINKNITLRSVNGRSVTTIQGVSGIGALGAVQIAPGSNGVTIGTAGKGFTIVGIDNGNPGIENAAVYFQGAHSNATIRDNEIVANGDGGLQTEFGQSITNFVIDGNIFSGTTFVPPVDGVGFGDQFSQPNRPRQLVAMGCGTNCASTSGIQFTNNQITGTAGGLNPLMQEQGNTLVTIDAANVTITGNTFAGTTTRFASSLRCRGSNTTISGNTFDGSNQTGSTSYMFLANVNTPNDLSTDPVSLAGVRAANSFNPPAVIISGQPATLFIGFNNLSLEIDDCPDDANGASGYQIAIELWMRDLVPNATGFAAFLDYDNVQLTYRPSLSSYTLAPFPLHVTGIPASEVSPGQIRLDGSAAFASPGTNADSLLATLVFDVNVECGPPDVIFDLTQPFPSELSLNGVGRPTLLLNTPAVTLDDTPPLLTAPTTVDIECSTALPAPAATLGAFLALAGANAVDNCALPAPSTAISSVTGPFVGTQCNGSFTRTYTIADACGNTATVNHVITVSDNTPPIVTPPTPVTLQCSDTLPPAVTTIADFLGLAGASANDNCTAQASLTVSSNDVVTMGGECMGVITRTYTITDGCGNATPVLHIFNVMDTTAPTITCPAPIAVDSDAGTCSAVLNWNEPFNNAVPLCGTQTPACYYTDRYNPAAFESATFLGQKRLKHSISDNDDFGSRPPPFQSLFYNTQGRKYDINMGVDTTLAIDLYIPLSWQDDARRADIWATTFDSQGAIAGFPIVGFIANDPGDELNPNPIVANIQRRFRIFTQDTDNNPGNGLTAGWVTLAPPGGSILYDTWYRLEIKLTATSYEFKVTDQNSNFSSYTDNVTFGAIRMGNTIIQAYNFSNNIYPNGDSYDVYWDNLTVGPQGPVAVDNCCIDTVTPVRSDNPLLDLDDPFPQGVTTITWTVTDCCGNTASCNQTVTVSGSNKVAATVQLAGVDAGAGITRCIEFTAKNGPTCAPPQYAQVNFVGNPATGVGSFNVPCGVWTSLCAKDEQHTLFSSQPITVTGPIYANASPIVLNSGDNDNDSDVDINDITWFIFQFGTPVVNNPSCLPWTSALRDADYSLNGVVGSEDYTFLTFNWLTFTSCPCTASVGDDDKPKSDIDDVFSGASDFRLEVLTAELPGPVGRKVDLNRDGVVNYKDVELFETRNGLGNELSSSLAEAMVKVNDGSSRK